MYPSENQARTTSRPARGRPDDAEAKALDLVRDPPGELEGTDLLSMVTEERDDCPYAIALLPRAIAALDLHPGHDVQTRVLMLERLPRPAPSRRLTAPLGPHRAVTRAEPENRRPRRKW